MDGSSQERQTNGPQYKQEGSIFDGYVTVDNGSFVALGNNMFILGRNDEPSRSHRRFSAVHDSSNPHRRIPFDRNKTVIDRTNIFSALDNLLPLSSTYQSAALWGPGGSGYASVFLFNTT